MVECEHCGKETKLPFKCKYCFGYFCEDCYLPQNHNCPNIDAWKSKKPPSGMDWSKITENKNWRPEKKEKPPEVIAEEEQLTEEEKEAYLSLRKHFCYACGKPLADHPIGICSACNLSFCPDHIRNHDCAGYDRIKVLPLGINYEDIYNICYYCGKKGATYKCSNCCGGRFCKEHKFPDDHKCRNRYGKSIILDAGQIKYLPPKKREIDCEDVLEPPQVVFWSPEINISGYEGESRVFEVEFSQTVDVSWEVNGEQVQTNNSVNKTSYSIENAQYGNWKITALGKNQNGMAYRVWNWNVKPEKAATKGSEKDDFPVDISANSFNEPPHKPRVSGSKKSKSSKSKVIAALTILFVIVGILGAYELGYFPFNGSEKPILIASQTPTATPTATPIPTLNLVDELTVSINDYSYIGTHDFSGIRVHLSFENSNEIPVSLTVIKGQTASGLNLLDSDRESKEPLDDFELHSGERTSREYFIPELRLSEVTSDKIKMRVKVSTEEVSQIKTLDMTFK